MGRLEDVLGSRRDETPCLDDVSLRGRRRMVHADTRLGGGRPPGAGPLFGGNCRFLRRVPRDARAGRADTAG